jgi:valacyclovir hydrolase
MPYFEYQGHQYFYRQQGSGPLLIILHGNTASSANHLTELAFFSGLGYHAVAFDFLGCGQSERLQTEWPLDWWVMNAHAARKLMDDLGSEQATVCGCSGGAVTALWIAILYPQRVKAVIADSLTPTYPPGILTREAENRSARTPGQVAFWRSAQGEDWEKVVDADSSFLTRLDAANPGGVDLFGERLREIHCPVLFTVSLTDSLLHHPGEQAIQMAKQVPGSWLIAVHAGDHPFMWSCPVAFQSAARDFINRSE